MAHPPRPVPHALRLHPRSRRDALDHTTPGHLRGPAFTTLTRGIYVAAGSPLDHGTRIRAARAALGEDAVVSGLSALWAHGIDLAEVSSPAQMTLARRVRRRAEIEVSRASLAPREIVRTAFGRTTSPARTAFDVGRLLPVPRAVAALDMLARVDPAAVSATRALAATRPGARGIRMLRQALDLVDPGSESPRESRLRVLLVLAGLPRPQTQVVVTHRGSFVARVDLGWPELRVAVEYDGAHHDTPERIRRDRDRLNRLRLAGWTVLVVDRHQLRHPDRVVAMVRSALATAAPRP
ncbi:DUF559 domain-containing protein [Paraoerskovia marina]|nr:DUF559 domain-containing protein [Paraoerskovia marina]